MKPQLLTTSKINLSLEEQVELGRRMTLFGDNAAREELILNCIPVVTTAARQFSNHLLASYDDLFQEGMVGVMESLERYDYKCNTKFSSFAYFRIIHRLAKWTKKQIHQCSPQTSAEAADGMILDATNDTFQEIYHTPPTDSQLGNLLSISDSEVAHLKKHYANPVPAVLRFQSYETVRTEDESYLSLDVESIVEKLMTDEFNHKHLYNAIGGLDELEQSIILRRHLYNDGEKKATLTEIAEDYSVNPSTVLRKERKALQKILDYFKENNIEPEL